MTPEQHSFVVMPPPPPSRDILPPTPAAPPFTVQQLLAYTVQTAKPPSSRSCGFVTNQSSRPAHSSSKRNEEYEPILSVSLYPIHPVVVAVFRTRVLSISATSQILFKDPLTLPWDGCSMVSEGMVTAYLDSQVLFAAWQAVLRMAPAVRNFDLEMVKQAPIDRGVPDQMFAIMTADGPEILAIVEFKSPGIVTSMLTVIRDHIAQVKRDQTDDWREVTRQLRKYAHTTGVRDILVMDEHTAIYFEYPEAAHKETEAVMYLVATTDPVAGRGMPEISMRELVVFVLLRALDRKGVELCDTLSSESTETHVNNPPGYRDVLRDNSDRGPGPGPSTNDKKRPGPGTGRREQPKRGKTANTSDTYQAFSEQFDGWVQDSSIQLEFLPHVAPVRGEFCDSYSVHSPDSGFGRSSPSHQRPRKLRLVPTTVNAAGNQTTSLWVERLITKNVAVLTTVDKSLRVIGKHFGLHHDAPIWLGKELAAYAACVQLQGDEMPYLYGVCRVVQYSPFANIILLTECIEPGTTIADLVHDAYFVYDTDDDDEIARLNKLQETGTRAMHSLHARHVIHNDLAGRNMLVSNEGDDERLVLVDFDCAMVFSEDTERFRGRVVQDEEKMRSTFQPKRQQ